MTRPRRPIEAGIRSGPVDAGVLEDAVRKAYSTWVSGVTVVAVRANGSVHGLTVSAFTPLSLQPPLILICVAGDAPVASHIEDARRFVVNVLAQDQRRVASRFADRFPIAPGIFPTDGDPIIDGALTALVCHLAEVHPGGDHRIYVGHVIRVERGPSDEPLTYFAREYRRLSPAAETA